MSSNMKTMLVAAILGACLLSVTAGAAVSANVSSAIAYPNPCNVRKGHKRVTFDNLPAWVRIRIYTKGGELARDISCDTVSGAAVWDLTNSEGSPVATGVYLYVLTDNSGHTQIGKVAVIQ
jgi:hypothetical protein